MKLYTFEINTQRRIGAEWEGQLIDLAATYGALLASQGPKAGALRVLPSEILGFIRLGSLAQQAARETIQYIKKRPAVPVGEELFYPLEQVKILAPIPRPGKILCCDWNYPAHPSSALSSPTPEEPLIFSKFPSTVIGPGEPIIQPAFAEQLEGGVVLGAVIGRRIKSAGEEEAREGILEPSASLGLLLFHSRNKPSSSAWALAAAFQAGMTPNNNLFPSWKPTSRSPSTIAFSMAAPPAASSPASPPS